MVKHIIIKELKTFVSLEHIESVLTAKEQYKLLKAIKAGPTVRMLVPKQGQEVKAQ